MSEYFGIYRKCNGGRNEKFYKIAKQTQREVNENGGDFEEIFLTLVEEHNKKVKNTPVLSKDETLNTIKMFSDDFVAYREITSQLNDNQKLFVEIAMMFKQQAIDDGDDEINDLLTRCEETIEQIIIDDLSIDDYQMEEEIMMYDELLAEII